MVGKLQDFVAASVVIGAVEKFGGGNRNAQKIQPSQNTEAGQISKVDKSESKFIVDTQGMQAEEDLFKQDEEQQKDFHLEPGTLDEESVDFMTKELNKLMEEINCNIEFTYHKDANMMSVKMVDKETQEVIKELPPEEMIENMIKAKDWLGAFLDKTI